MTEDDLTDVELVRRVTGGEPEMFRHLLARYQLSIYRYAYSKTKNAEDAEDLTQQVFISAFTALRSFDTHRPFAPWLFRIAANCIISARRKERQKVSLDTGNNGLSIEVASAVDVAREVEARLALRRIELAVGELPANQQTLFRMRYGEDKSLEEIARLTNQKAGTVAVALHRLRERLTNYLG